MHQDIQGSSFDISTCYLLSLCAPAFTAAIKKAMMVMARIRSNIDATTDYITLQMMLEKRTSYTTHLSLSIYLGISEQYYRYFFS
jgi:hypothetical protein